MKRPHWIEESPRSTGCKYLKVTSTSIIMDSFSADEALERQQDELDFLTAAYEPEEAWVVNSECVYRRLHLPHGDAAAQVLLVLYLPRLYPVFQCLEVSGSVESGVDSVVEKAARAALPDLLRGCTQVAQALQGSDAILSVLEFADDWVNDHWPTAAADADASSNKVHNTKHVRIVSSSTMQDRSLVSHHD
jgi:hypothetical protein